jgi:hypothetical protein
MGRKLSVDRSLASPIGERRAAIEARSVAYHLRLYQSQYFVPSSAVAVDVERTSNTLLPPQLVASGSS